jgi:hypothetical protein
MDAYVPAQGQTIAQLLIATEPRLEPVRAR